MPRARPCSATRPPSSPATSCCTRRSAWSASPMCRPTSRAGLFGLLDDAIYVSAAGELADVENASRCPTTPRPTPFSTRRSTRRRCTPSALRWARAPCSPAHRARRSLHSTRQAVGSDSPSSSWTTSSARSARPSRPGATRAATSASPSARPCIALARQTPAWSRVNEALAVAHTGPIAVREAQLALEESGARLRLRLLIDDTLDAVRTGADDRDFPLAGASAHSRAGRPGAGADPVSPRAHRPRALRPDGTGCRGRRHRRVLDVVRARLPPARRSPAAARAQRLRAGARRGRDRRRAGGGGRAGSLRGAPGARRARGGDPRGDRPWIQREPRRARLRPHRAGVRDRRRPGRARSSRRCAPTS